ncbi:hypothetical protein GQA56_04395 [Escherichia coli]|uniref:hypothetical protein n=1 Tax=Escherichia coli TaxID=562 RepID=UPI0006A585CB|nr:hypothetical protein [Escherichia coli]EIP8028341.1 hypothetical protein [Escherichia coli]MZR38197.1 hypothetical protein [Escherichia coli]
MAVITPADPIQLTELEKVLTRLRVLDVDVKANREELFNLFIKEFRSASLVEEYLRSSAYVKAYIKAKEADEGFLHRTVVALSEQMKAVNDGAQQKKMTPRHTHHGRSVSRHQQARMHRPCWQDISTTYLKRLLIR